MEFYPSEEISPDLRRSLHNWWKSASCNNGEGGLFLSPDMIYFSIYNLKTCKEACEICLCHDLIKNNFQCFCLAQFSKCNGSILLNLLIWVPDFFPCVTFDCHKMEGQNYLAKQWAQWVWTKCIKYGRQRGQRVEKCKHAKHEGFKQQMTSYKMKNAKEKNTDRLTRLKKIP